MDNDQQTQLPPPSDEGEAAPAPVPSQLEPTESAAATPTPAPAARKLEKPATWPGNVPAQEQALEVLRGRQLLVVSLPGARRLQEKLTLPEREALLDDGLADALRDAVAMRWRLAAAQDLLLTAEGKVDEVALNALLAEVDRTLEALRASNPASPDLALAIDRTWETLTQEAVDFSSNVKAAANAKPEPVHAAPKKPTATAGKVTFQAEEPQQQGKTASQKFLFAALALVIAAVGAYHALNRTQGPPPPPPYPGAPANTLVFPDSSTGALVVRSTHIGPTSPELQAWLKQQQVKGMLVKELGPGNYLVLPAPKAPATAGNTPP